ncbi:MAG: hypothetical protein IIB02_06000, partial [Thaumarchaeota archaeon]|nr:hypothetical protein [Nitrososphaerota archaeon]
MKSNLKIIYFFTLISILLYFSSFDEVSGVHKTGDDIIHTNIYELKIKSSPPGLQFNNSAMYEDGVWVEIDVAQKKWGAYNFVGWSIDKNRVDGNPITVLMDKDHTATAIYAIHPAKNQDSVSFTQDKNAYDLTIISAYGKTLGSGSYYNGEIVYFRVLDQYVSDEIYEGVRYAFSKWSDGYNPNLMSNFIKMNGSKIITTDWSKQYRLEILDSNQNMKVVSTSWHSANSTAPLVMSSFETEFDGQVKHKINEWISVGSNHAVIKDPKNSITSVVMDNPYSISVDWKNQFYLNINSKYGKVEGSGFYDEGDMIVATIDSEIQKTGISGTRLIFDGWSGDASSDGTNVQIMMNEPKSIEGKWKKQFELVVNSKYGNPNGAGWYDEGEIATFGTNIPREPIGFWQQNTFQGWSGDAEIESNTGVILMNGPKIITAKWGIDYFIAFMNIGIISSTAIGGLFIYKKMKKGKKQEKLSQKDTNESTLIKTKKQGLSGITKELATKINSKMKFDNNQDLIQNYTMKKISDDVKPQNKEGLQEKEILEKSIGEVEFEKREIIINLEKRLAEMKLETKKTSIELENNLAEVELGKKSLANKTEQLEKSLFKVELQKKNISEEKEILEKSIGDIELEKKRIAAELERKEATFEFERQATSQRTSELENRISKAEIEKK